MSSSRLILEHAGFEVSDKHIGIVGFIRPYSGVPDSEFIDLVNALLQWNLETVNNPLVDRFVPAAIWHLCEQVRTFALRDDCTLRRAGIISTQEFERLNRWIAAIELCFIRLLCQNDTACCFHPIAEILVDIQPKEFSRFNLILDVLRSSANYDDNDIASIAREVVSLVEESGPAG